MSDEPEDALAEIGADRPSPLRSTSAAAWEPDDSMVPPKPGLPRWLKLGCGCGCLGAFLFTAFLLVMGYLAQRDAENPEVQWARLQALLPFDQRPAELELQFGMRVPALFVAGPEQIRLSDSRGRFQVDVRDVRSSGAVLAFMNPEEGTSGERVEGWERGTIEVQDRSVPILRFERSRLEIPFLDLPEEDRDLGPGVRLDLSDQGHFVLVDIRRGHAGEPISEAEIEDFFRPFDVWRGR